MEKELIRLQREGIVQPVESSDWAAPTVIVRKEDGSIRIWDNYKVAINPF